MSFWEFFGGAVVTAFCLIVLSFFVINRDHPILSLLLATVVVVLVIIPLSYLLGSYFLGGVF